MPAKTPSSYPSDVEGIDYRDANTESGYVSGGSSDDYVPEIVFTKPHLQFLNRQLQFLEPQGMYSSTWVFNQPLPHSYPSDSNSLSQTS